MNRDDTGISARAFYPRPVRPDPASPKPEPRLGLQLVSTSTREASRPQDAPRRGPVRRPGRPGPRGWILPGDHALSGWFALAAETGSFPAGWLPVIVSRARRSSNEGGSAPVPSAETPITVA